MSIFYHKEDKKLIKTVHTKIEVKNTKVNTLFDSNSQANLIASNLVNNFGLEVHDHPIPYPLGCVNKDAQIKVIKQCNIKFVESVDFIDEVELDVVPIDMCRVFFESSYMYMMDAIFMQQKMNTT